MSSQFPSAALEKVDDARGERVDIMRGVECVCRAERRVPEWAGSLSPWPDVCVWHRMVVIPGGDTVVHLVLRRGDIEVLRPQHRMLFWERGFDSVSAGVVTAMNPFSRGRVDLEISVERQRVDDVVDAVGRPDVH